MGFFKELYEQQVAAEMAKRTCECVRCFAPMEESDYHEGNGFCVHCTDLLVREDMRATFSEVSLCR
jgi:hypothetical protein